MERKPFWMIWRADGATPTHRHETPEEAQREAERLARQYPGSVFYVLKAVQATRRVDVQTVSLVPDGDPDEIPF